MKLTQVSFNKILKDKFIFEKKPKIAVAVSGGPDSMALVFLLNVWIRGLGGELIATIVNHQIREKSKIEAKEISLYLNEKGIKNKVINVGNRNVLKKNMNEARMNRFSKILNFCKKENILHLFLGHHFNDNIETFFIRNISGSNFEGLKCIQVKVINKNVQILRPLLLFKKIDLVNFNKINNIKYINDPSNENSDYTRVAVRKYLSKDNKIYKKVLKDFNLIQINYPTYKKMIFNLFNKSLISFSNKSMIIDYNFFKEIDDELKSKIIAIIYSVLRPNKNIRYLKIKNIINLIDENSLVSANLGGMKINKSNIHLFFNV